VRVSRKRIMESMRRVDPAGVAQRKSRAVVRRVYHVADVNSLWHIDGTHKLIHYGFVIHTCIDGKSRYLVYIACADNNRADTVKELFTKA
jgi:hypothetical protein